MIKINIQLLLKNKNKSKYWLCQQMNMTNRNLNRIIDGQTTSISFKHIEDFCRYLDCNPNELFTIDLSDEEIYDYI